MTILTISTLNYQMVEPSLKILGRTNKYIGIDYLDFLKNFIDKIKL